MSSKQKMNNKDQETFNVTKIYEHVKSRKFLEQLCLECIQDVKQKPAYQSLKGMVDRLLNSSMASTGSPSNDAERITSMRMQVAECGMLAYTIDCVVAEVVCNKLEKEYFSMVKEIVTELAQKRNVEVAEGVPTHHSENHVNGTKEENNEEGVSNLDSEHIAAPDSRSPARNAAEKSVPKSILKNRNCAMNGDLSPPKGKSGYIVQKMERPNTRNYNVESQVGNENKVVDRPIQRSHNQVVDIVISKDMGHNAAGREIHANQVEVHAGNVTNRPQSVLEIVSSPIQSNNSPNSTCKVVVVSSHGAIIKHVISHDNANKKFSQSSSNPNTPVQSMSLSPVSAPLEPVVESVKPNATTTEEVRKSPRKVASPRKCSNYIPTVVAEASDDALSESDGEKAFSVGSVSPVHTSDLSSFDDLISLSEDDEQGNSKKKIRLKDANNIFLDGKLPELYRKKKRGRPKSSPKNKSPTAGKVIQPEHDSSSEEESPDWTPRKSLPQRKRKPNSKYDSEIYKCNLMQIMNSEDPELKEGKHPAHNRTEPRPLKKLHLDPISDDIVSISTNLPLTKQNEEASISNKVEDNNLQNDLNSNLATIPDVRKRGRPRKSLDTSSNSYCGEDSNDVSSPVSDLVVRKRGRPRKVSEPIISGKRMTDSDSFVSSEETPKRMRNDSAHSRMSENSPSKEKNSQRYSAAELYKPRPNIYSFGSRSNRVITLCSTP